MRSHIFLDDIIDVAILSIQYSDVNIDIHGNLNDHEKYSTYIFIQIYADVSKSVCKNLLYLIRMQVNSLRTEFDTIGHPSVGLRSNDHIN